MVSAAAERRQGAAPLADVASGPGPDVVRVESVARALSVSVPAPWFVARLVALLVGVVQVRAALAAAVWAPVLWPGPAAPTRLVVWLPAGRVQD